MVIYSQLSRCSTARVSVTRFSLVGPTKITARKYFLFTEGSLKVENKEQLFDFVFIVNLFASKLYAVAKCHSQLSKVEDEVIISQIVRISEGCDQNGNRVSKNDKSCHICSMRLKGVLVTYEKYGTMFIYLGIDEGETKLHYLGLLRLVFY